MVLAQVVLGGEADGEVGHDGRVDSDAEVRGEVEEDRGVDHVESDLRELAVQEVEWQRSDESKENGQRTPLVTASDREEFVWHPAPRDGLFFFSMHVSKQDMIFARRCMRETNQRVIALRLLAGPNVGSLDGKENLPLAGDNAVHHDIVEDRSDRGAHHLHGECDSRRQVAILRQLHVGQKKRALGDRIVSLATSTLGKKWICERHSPGMKRGS